LATGYPLRIRLTLIVCVNLKHNYWRGTE